MELSARHQVFCDQYVLSNNGARSAIAAGYSERSARITASKLLTNPNIQGALRARKQVLESELQVTRQRVLDGLQEAVDLARVQGNPVALVSAWREIAKICGYYAPERKHIELSAGSEALVAKYQALSDAELLMLVESH